MEYLTEIKVRGYHADFYGHVNNARYLEFFEEDRWANLESRMDLGKMMAMGLVFLVVNINVNYRKAVAVGEILLVRSCLDSVGSKSAVLRQEIIIKGSEKIAADALVTFVILDRSGRAVAMEGELLEQVKGLGQA